MWYVLSRPKTGAFDAIQDEEKTLTIVRSLKKKVKTLVENSGM